MDIEQETVDWRENYDGTAREPVVLPTRLPNLLINGSQGIAVGLATNIPPHNPNEIIDGLILLLDQPAVTIDSLMEVIKGPDFPTGGLIYGQNDIKTALSTGRGRIIIRGRAEIVEEKNRSRVIISELPYQTNKATFISHLAGLVKDKRLEGISDIRDESDRTEGVRVVIDLKLGAPANKILNGLYERSELQTVVHYNLVALVDGLQPRLLNILDVLRQFLLHRSVVVTRRSEFQLKAAKARSHILEGLKIALDHLDAIIALIRSSADRERAKQGLISRFQLSEIQANAILEMRLSQLANLERQRVYDEYAAILLSIKDLEDILAKPERVQKIIRGELEETKKQFTSTRQTEIVAAPLGQLTALDLVPQEQIIVSLTEGNYVKRLAADTYKSQLRGGKGVVGMATKEDDFVQALVYASTHDDLLFFTDRGRVFKIKAYEVPVSSRQSKGTALANLIRVASDERVTVLLALNINHLGSYFFLGTRDGLVKRLPVASFQRVRSSGTTAMGLKTKDKLVWVKLTGGQDEIIQITKHGQMIVYPETDVRSMGRSARGVRGIRLKASDEVIETEIITDEVKSVAVISERGLGKRIKVEQLRNQHRGGSGVKVAKITTKTGSIAAAATVSDAANDALIATASGQIIRISVAQVKILSRLASGVILIRLDKTDKVTSLMIAAKKENIEDAKE